MKPVSAALLHVTAVFAASVASSRIAAVLPGASDVPDELLRVITVILPGTLVLQSALITLLTAGHRNRDRSRYQDALFVILINASAILLPISGGRNLLTFSTGMWIVTGLLIRSVFMTRCLVRYMTSNPAGPAALLTGILVFLLILPLAGWRLTARPLDGDEPYYLLQSYSMLHDHDLDLKNNYLDGDSLSFVPRKLQPQQFDDYENGRLLSRHPPLMSLVLIPGFAVAGNHGAIVTILILTALLGSLMVVVLKNFCLPYSTAIMVAVLICLTAPVILYSTAIFTETAGAVLGMAAVAVALKLADRRKLPYAATALVLAGAFALKPRFAILTLPPIIAGIAFRYGFSRRLVRIISFLGLMVISVAAMNLVLYGNPLVRHSLEDLPAFSFTRLFRGTVGLFWDPQYGAFPLNPLMFLAVPGAIILLRRASASRRTIWLSSWIPYFCSVAIMAELSGGICPRGRFNVAWLPLFGIAAAFALHAAFQSAKRWCVFPAVISSVTITGLLLLRNDWQIVYPGSVDHMISKLSLTLNRDILSVLPGFDRVNSQLYATGGMLAFLTVMAGLIPLLSPRWLRRIRLPDVTGSVLVILCLMSVLVAGCNAWQTPWMHTEDVSFESRGNVRMFWEETRDWEFRTMSPSPYRAGQRIHSGGELVRALPFRPPEHPHKGSLFLEIEARGSVPDHSVPRFSVRIDDSPKITVRLRSTVFEIYRIQCPDDFDPERSTLTIDIPEETGSAVWCDIDRMRLAYQPFIPREIPPHPDRHLPIEFDRWEVRDARLTPENILQGESVELALEYDLSHTPAPAAAVLLKSGTRTSYHPLTLSEDPGINEITSVITPDPSAGSGTFDIILLARPDSRVQEFLIPGGINTYRIGHGAWLGKLNITSNNLVPDSEWLNLAAEVTDMEPAQLALLPVSCHLSERNRISTAISMDSGAKQLILISHVSHVFEEISFQTQIGEIRLDSAEKSVTIPVIIGRDTAEAMYEFGGKNVRLSHGRPPVIARKKTRIRWPFILEGMEYDALYFEKTFDLDFEGPFDTITLRTLSFPGVWNVAAVIMVNSQ